MKLKEIHLKDGTKLEEVELTETNSNAIRWIEKDELGACIYYDEAGDWHSLLVLKKENGTSGIEYEIQPN